MQKKWFLILMLLSMVCIGGVQMQRKAQVQNPAMPQAQIEKIHLPEPDSSPAAAQGDAEKEEMPDGGGYFVVRTYAGKLAVYRVYADGTRVLAEIMDTEVSTLPDKDVKSLEEGIVVRSREALTRLLEDFMS